MRFKSHRKDFTILSGFSTKYTFVSFLTTKYPENHRIEYSFFLEIFFQKAIISNKNDININGIEIEVKVSNIAFEFLVYSTDILSSNGYHDFVITHPNKVTEPYHVGNFDTHFYPRPVHSHCRDKSE